MGILDRFRKTENVHFERNNDGKVVNTTRTYEGRGSRTPVSDSLLKQHQQERQAKRQIYQQAYQDAYQKARVKRETERGRRAGSTTWDDRLNNFTHHPTRRQSYTSYKTQDNYNPFGSMFDTGISYGKPPSRKKSSSKTKYKVIGGKAYPIAGTVKKHKSKKRSNSKKNYDPFNAFGGYKF